MNLANHSADAWTIAADSDKQIFRDKSHCLIHVNNLDVSETLPIRAHFILALHDKNTLVL
jgi:hypothetical protein